MTKPKPVVLCILDGWGHREETDHNAIAQANTPNWDTLLKTYPNGVINASEGEVGLPDGQMGNSEVGHMNIGAGRIVMQDLPRIDTAIADGSLASNKELKGFISDLQQSGGACHLMGLLSDGGVHAHMHHIITLAKIIAAEGIQVYLHAFLDGRDTPPRSAGGYIKDTLDAIKDEPNILLASVCGRYFAMDRDQRWDRIERAYRMLVDAAAAMAVDANAAIMHAYEIADTGDEFVAPCTLRGYPGMKDGDGLLMANFRADRARQILQALLYPSLDGFSRDRIVSFAAVTGMIEYAESLNPYHSVLFAPIDLPNTLGELISNAGMHQLRIAETEKYAHVTFFMSGGREETFNNEERILISSPDVTTYDLKPEMSAVEVTDKLVEAIESNRFDCVIVNYANTDMVGHTGKIDAAIQAVETVDRCIGRLVEAVTNAGGAMLITADHGNAECMHDPSTGQSHTAHTLNLVPAVLIADEYKGSPLSVREGRLADIAPTLLDWLGIDKPKQMTGESLLPDTEAPHAARA